MPEEQPGDDHRLLHPEPFMDLNLPSLKEEQVWNSQEVVQGFKLSHVNHVLPSRQLLRELGPGSCHSQSIHRLGDIFWIERKDCPRPLPLPTFSEEPALHDCQNSIPALRSALNKYANNHSQTLEYSVYSVESADSLSIAQFYGIPRSQNRKVFSSFTETFMSLRKTILDLQSINILWSGQPVVWLVISSRHASKLEARIAHELDASPQCSQFTKHAGLLVSPEVLTIWGIQFSMFVQYAGDVVKTDHGVYFQKWSTGPNLAEGVSSCEADWFRPPLLQTYCDSCVSEVESRRNPEIREICNTDGSITEDECSEPTQSTCQLTNNSLCGDFGFADIENSLQPRGYVDGDAVGLAYAKDLGRTETLGNSAQSQLSGADHQPPQNLLNTALDISDDIFALYDAFNSIPEISVYESASSEPNHSTDPLGENFHTVEHQLDVAGVEEIVHPPVEEEEALMDLSTSPPSPQGPAERASQIITLSSMPRRRGRSAQSADLENLTQAIETSTLPHKLSQNIEEVLALGLGHRENLSWSSSKYVDSEHVLISFRPSASLHIDAVSEGICALAAERDEVVWMEIPQFYLEFSQGKATAWSGWDHIEFIMVPVSKGNWIFLISVDVRNRLIQIHDCKSHDDIVSSLTEIQSISNGWVIKYKVVSQFTQEVE